MRKLQCPSPGLQEVTSACTDRVIISHATDKEETISKPMKVSKGQAMVKVDDKCKLYTFRLAVLIPGRSEVSVIYSSHLM